MAKALSGQIARRISGQSKCLCNGGSKQRIAERVQHQRQRAFRNMVLVMADGQLRDEASDGIEDWVEGVAVSAKDHPGGECSCSLLSKRIETLVDNDSSIGLACTRAFDGISDAPVDRIGDGFGKRPLEPGSRPEVVEQIGVGAANFGGHRLQGYGLRTLLEQQPTCGSERGRPAFFWAKACSSY